MNTNQFLLMLNPPSLSKRSAEVLREIIKFRAMKGYFPTVREVGSLTDIASTANVKYHLNKLIAAGALEAVMAESGKRLARAWIVTPLAEGFLMENGYTTQN